MWGQMAGVIKKRLEVLESILARVLKSASLKYIAKVDRGSRWRFANGFKAMWIH